MRFAETFSTVVFIGEENSCWKVCAQKSFWREQLFAVTETFSAVVFICGKKSCWRFVRRKRFLKRIVVCGLQKHFLQNIFYSGIYLRFAETFSTVVFIGEDENSSWKVRAQKSFWVVFEENSCLQLFAVTEIFICGKTSCWKVCEQKKVFEENSCLRLTETFSTVVFICEENSYWKVCAQKKVFKEIVVCVETFSTVVFLCRKFFSWGFPFCWTILLAEW